MPGPAAEASHRATPWLAQPLASGAASAAHPLLFCACQVALHHLPGRHATGQLWGPPLHLSHPQRPADSL